MCGIIRFVRLGHNIKNPKFDQNPLRIASATEKFVEKKLAFLGNFGFSLILKKIF